MEPMPRQPGSTALTSRTRPDGFFKNFRKMAQKTGHVNLAYQLLSSLVLHSD